jgi:hypothetical protein
MGWCSGSQLFSDVIDVISQNVPDEEDRVVIYKGLISAFEEFDWDTQDECVGEDSAYDSALKELHPEWYEDEDNEEDEQ